MIKKKSPMYSYIMSKPTVTLPILQNEFKLPYSNVKEVLNDLVAQGEITYEGGITYNVSEAARSRAKSPFYIPKDEDEKFYIKVLWKCIKHNRVSAAFIQRETSCYFGKAIDAIEWMENNKFVEDVSTSDDYKLTVTAEDYVELFGEPEQEQNNQENTTEQIRRNYHLSRIRRETERRKFMRRLLDEDDDGDNDTDNDGDNDTDNDGDNDTDDDFADNLDELLGREERSTRLDDYLKKNEIKRFLSKKIDGCLDKMIDDGNSTMRLGNEVFSFSFIEDLKIIQISNSELPITDSNTKTVQSVLKEFPMVKVNEHSLTVMVESLDSFLLSLMNLYTAVYAVKKRLKIKR